MHRMRLFPICGGEDEPKGDPPEDSQGPTKAEVAELQQQLQQAEGNRKKLEAMLLDPSYVEFIATRTKGGVKEKPEGKAAEDEPDFDAMSTKDLVKFLDGRWEQRVSELVKGVREESAHDRSVRVINETAGRHADFWEYRETLEQIAQAYPNLHPEHAYLLAKQLPKPAKAAAAREEVAAAVEPRATPSERPSNANRSTRVPAAANGADAFKKAWKQHVGNKESL